MGLGEQMATIIAVITAVGVVVTILANLTNIARFVHERRERRGSPPGVPVAMAAGASGGAALALTPPRPPPSAILTPDQRIRVFVSSTLQELATERALVRSAIEDLHLTPVMFELGARAHPPADLYRAYLAQSDVFVGIYGESYGWVAPGANVSGLEDEYLSSSALPSLIYVKAPAPQRDERLEALLARVRDEARASYRRYSTPQELAELVSEDLAVLLTERFHRPAAGADGDDPTAEPAPRDWQAGAFDAFVGPPTSGVVEQVPPLPLAPLPRPLTSFVGRADSLRRLSELVLLPDTRLVTLHGPGGIGKSRLALEAARGMKDAFRDGVAFVSLDSVRDPALVPTEIAFAVGLYETATSGPVERLVSVLGRRELLLVLDNFEGLLTAVPHVTRLLAAAPGLKVMVTSRTLLRLSGEVSFPVPPMNLPEADMPLTPAAALEFGAVKLFVERVRAVLPAFELDDEAVASVVNVCRRLDGLPLSIELAAARLGTMSVSALEERMTQLLPLLTGGPRDAPARQRTLRATIAWSYDLLDREQRVLFVHMAVFEGSADLESIEEVLGPKPGILDGLRALVDASLLTRLDPDAGRLGLLETLREFAREELTKDPLLPELERRHAHHFLELVAAVPDALRGPEQQRWLERLRHDEGNLRNAFGWFVKQGDAVSATTMAVRLRPYWQRVGALEEGRRRLAQAAAVPGEVDDGLRARAALADGVLAWRQGDLATAGTVLERALALAQGVPDVVTVTTAQRVLGALAQNHADYLKATRLLEAGAAGAKARGDVEAVASTYLSLGNVALDQGRSEVAVGYYQDSLQLARRTGDTWGTAMALDNLSVAAWYAGDLATADRLGREALALYQELVLPSGCANIWHRDALVAYARGDLATAEAQGRVALRVRRAQGEARGAAFVIYDLARVALARGDAAGAATLLAEGLELALPQQAPVLDLLYVQGTAAYLVQMERFDEAYVLLRVVDAWRERIGVPVAPVNRREVERLKQQVERVMARKERKERIGLEAMARQLTYEEAVERATYALGISGYGRTAKA